MCRAGSGFIPGGGGSITADAKQSGTPGNPDEDKDDEDEDEDVLERVSVVGALHVRGVLSADAFHLRRN